MAQTPEGIFGDKLDFMDQAGDRLKNRYASAERWLLAKIIEEAIPELDVEDGNIKNTNRNVTVLTSKLNAIFGQLRTGPNKDIVTGILEDMQGITEFNGRYFSLRGS